ncbi:putative disease resistance protein rga3 [Phtheirospermum japonicum]|uniref:Putative disease resistance protein rga3 n=1 Tax=Phtheirospermum japonicum TaxID=374723 RepID=A0A830BGS6_9LAMI|nr:putative disease resistance protein rga3 [Phtheirospermum japonicum]
MSQEQISLVRNFKNDLEMLQRKFSTVKAFLHDAEKKQVTNEAVKRWLRDLETLAFEADNVFDEFSYQLLSKEVRATTGNKTLKKRVQSFFPCSNSNPIAYRLKLGRRIKDIDEKLKSITQRGTEFGLQTIVAQAPVYASASRQTDSFSEDPVFLGRENDVSRMVKMLSTTDEQKLSVLPIVGMGGQGKTTLARAVFNHEQIKSHFGGNCVWVHVPRNFDVVVLLEKILTSMEIKNVEHGNREALLKMLQKHLGAKKYLLVLDDVWNEDRTEWDDFVSSFSGISSLTGNCMIVTTRSHNAALIVKTLPVHELEGLSEDDCWSIIKAKAFNRSGEISLEFETMGRKIAKRCQGLPLAAKVAGGLLRNKSKDEWREIENNRLSNFGDDQNTIPKILKLSFDHLSSPSLKKCFAYCSIFPKGYMIEKEQMIELWMAEGFLQTDHQGNNINMETTNSLLQVARSDDYGNVTHCNMHDLVHDLAFSILYENDNVTNGDCQSRYIGYNSSGDGLLSIPKGQERYVRTLFFNGKVSNITFSDFKSLRTLTLVGEEDIDDLPTSIREIKHLRYLDISETRIKYLPDSIGELYHLQTLRAKKGSRWKNYLEKLPDFLSCLISLRHLHISDDIALPPEIGKLTSLQTLSYFHVGGEKGCGISELGSLKNLKGKLEICNLEQVRDKNEATRADLLGKPGICELMLEWGLFREGDGTNDESVLEGLQPHPNLKRLEICRFKGKRLPVWTSKMTHLAPCLGGGGALPLLRELVIRDCTSLRELPDLHSLNSLEVLDIEDCPDLKSIGYPISSGGGGGHESVRGFTSLRRLQIKNCEGLTNLPIEIVESCAPSLEELTLKRLSSITNMGMVIGCLHKMTRLGELEITEVPKFSSEDIIGSLSTNNSVQELRMSPLSSSSPDSSSSDSSSWNNVSFNEAVDAMLLKFISLRSLTLDGMEHWDSLPDQLQHLTSLEDLTLREFGIEALPEWFGNLSSLKSLTLWNYKKLRHLPSKQAMQRLSKLKFLSIIECPLLIIKEKKKSNNNNDNTELPQIVDSEWPKISYIPSIFVDLHQISSDRDGH